MPVGPADPVAEVLDSKEDIEPITRAQIRSLSLTLGRIGSMSLEEFNSHKNYILNCEEEVLDTSSRRFHNDPTH